MMKSTSPTDYARIENFLPGLDPEVTIDKIMEIELAWREELLKHIFMSPNREGHSTAGRITNFSPPLKHICAVNWLLIQAKPLKP
ncbi:MAG: DUF4125 family protein, partial [Desulfotomaculaceae bacterium]|nr:DUF4125 family protein [Desulfotomaculaceae bacterium]